MFDYLKQYVEPFGNDFNQFYCVNQDEIFNAESRMKCSFPEELKLFYEEIGFGFISRDINFFNRIMSPSDIADFMCDDELYDYVDKTIYGR